jgi:hypothetical protein
VAKAIINIGAVGERNICEIMICSISIALLVDSSYITYNNLYHLIYSKHIRL